MSAPLTIRRFRSEDAEAVRAIFVHGMWGLLPQMTRDLLSRPAALLALAVPCGSAAALHWFRAGKPPLWAQALAVLLGLGAIPLGALAIVRRLMGNYINYSLKDDLADIQKAYSEPGSAFWVAEMEGQGVVGMVGLHRRSDTVAELRRLSVKEGIRGAGIATKLCQELARHAKEQRFEGVFLVTTSAQQPALRLYWKQGWKTDKVWWGTGIKFYQLTLNLVQLEAEANGTTDKQA